jgi:hypothetical protein
MKHCAINKRLRTLGIHRTQVTMSLAELAEALPGVSMAR